MRAIKAGGELSAFGALKAAEATRTRLTATLAAAAEPVRTNLDARVLEQKAQRVMSEWSAVLARRQPEARQMLRTLLVGRLTFRAAAEKTWCFSGRGSVRLVLSGVLSEDYLMRWRPQRDSAHGVTAPLAGFVS